MKRVVKLAKKKIGLPVAKPPKVLRSASHEGTRDPSTGIFSSVQGLKKKLQGKGQRPRMTQDSRTVDSQGLLLEVFTDRSFRGFTHRLTAISEEVIPRKCIQIRCVQPRY